MRSFQLCFLALVTMVGCINVDADTNVYVYVPVNPTINIPDITDGGLTAALPKLPAIPEIPAIPAVPSVPSVPSVPQYDAGVPSTPTVPVQPPVADAGVPTTPTAPDAGAPVPTTPTTPAPVPVEGSVTVYAAIGGETTVKPGSLLIAGAFGYRASMPNTTTTEFAAQVVSTNAVHEIVESCSIRDQNGAGCESALVSPDQNGQMHFVVTNNPKCAIPTSSYLYLDLICTVRADAADGMSFSLKPVIDPHTYAAPGASQINVIVNPLVPMTVTVKNPIVHVGKITKSVVALPSTVLQYGTNVVLRVTLSASSEADQTVEGFAFSYDLNSVGATADFHGVRAVGYGTYEVGAVADIGNIWAYGGTARALTLTNPLTIAAGTSKTFDFVVKVSGTMQENDTLEGVGILIMQDGAYIDDSNVTSQVLSR